MKTHIKRTKDKTFCGRPQSYYGASLDFAIENYGKATCLTCNASFLILARDMVKFGNHEHFMVLLDDRLGRAE